MGLVARAIEEASVPTVSLSNVKGATRRVKPPRSLVTRFPADHPVGPAGDVATQRAVVQAALDLLETARAAGELREFTA